jgi:hypothetical protein
MWLQRYIVREVYRAFASLAGLPEQESRQIEDLADLQRFNIAIAELADCQEALDARQGTLEQSQELVRQAWRDIRAEIRAIAARVAVIEQHVGGVISREQRGYIYQLVQAWGAAKAEREAASEQIGGLRSLLGRAEGQVPYRALRGPAGRQVRRLRHVHPAVLPRPHRQGTGPTRANHARFG